MKIIVSLMAVCVLSTSAYARATHQSVDKIRVKQEVVEPLFYQEAASSVINH